MSRAGHGLFARKLAGIRIGGWFLIVVSVFASATTPAAAPPNIVVILADDMGYSDIGCFGSEIQTPAIDRLAAEGIRFTQFYNGARCNPTRASLLTGLHPARAGMAWITEDLGLPAYLGHLNRRCVTIAEVLRPAGYTTLMAGKWHLGHERGQWPVDRAFDRYFGLLQGAGSYWEVLPGGAFQMALDDQPWKPDAGDHDYYLTDAITDRAIDFLGGAARAAKPFFLYLAYTAPHWPLHAWPADIAKYRGKYRVGWDEARAARYRRQLELGIIDPKWALSPRDGSVPAWADVPEAERDLWDLRMAVYAAMVDRMDQGIGRVIDQLERLGQRDNTLVMFLSDNGGCHLDPSRDTAGSNPDTPPGPRGGYWGYGPPWANVSDTPFRKFKQFVHEGGIATPLICSWPRGIKAPGRINRQPGQVMDIMATVLEVTGATYPAARAGESITPLDGLSFASVLRGERRAELPAMFWEHNGNQAVRVGDWKLVATHSARDGWELYELAVDRTELHDRAADLPDRVGEMKAMYQRWSDEVGLVPNEEAKRRRSERKNTK
jgi:arylsulfatase A-like enzyme